MTRVVILGGGFTGNYEVIVQLKLDVPREAHAVAGVTARHLTGRGTIVGGALFALLALVLAACGGSSAKPTPTSAPKTGTVAARPIPTDRQAVATALQFLRAFKRRDNATLLRLESPALFQRNQHEFIAQMLGVQNQPRQVGVVRAHTYRSRAGRWTRVVARLTFKRGRVVDALAVIRTRAGYRINTITHLRSS